MKDFGGYMKQLREAQRLSLRDVEELAGVSNAYLSLIETGKRKNPPAPKILLRLAEVYRVPYTDLMMAAGYLVEPGNNKEKQKAEIDRAFRLVIADSNFHWGTRLKGRRVPLEAKKVIIEMYEKLTGRTVL